MTRSDSEKGHHPAEVEALKLHRHLGEDFEEFLEDIWRSADFKESGHHRGGEASNLFKHQAYMNLAEFKQRLENGYRILCRELAKRVDDDGGN